MSKEPEEFLDISLEVIDNSPELELFFKRLFESQSIAKLFFLHRDELFPSAESARLPCLFWTNYLSKEVKPSDFKVISLVTELDEIKRGQAAKVFSGLFEGIIEDVKDVIMYYLIRFVRTNKDVQTLIESEDFSFKKMKQVLRDYKAIKLELPESLEKTTALALHDRDLEFKIKKLSKSLQRFSEDISRNPLEILENLPFLLPDFHMAFHMLAQKQIADLCKISGLSLEDYKSIINDMYTLKLIQCQHTVFWCQSCQDEPQVLKTVSEIGPSYLKMKCLRCGKSMSISSVYRMDELLEECILSKDGLLSVGIAWLLDQKNIEYEASAYGREYEYDFILNTLKGKILLECKVHRKPLSERSVKGELEKDLKQLFKHAQELNFQTGVLVYNYDVEKYSDIIKETCCKYTGMTVLDYANISRFLDPFKAT